MFLRLPEFCRTVGVSKFNTCHNKRTGNYRTAHLYAHVAAVNVSRSEGGPPLTPDSAPGPPEHNFTKNCFRGASAELPRNPSCLSPAAPSPPPLPALSPFLSLFFLPRSLPRSFRGSSPSFRGKFFPCGELAPV